MLAKRLVELARLLGVGYRVPRGPAPCSDGEIVVADHRSLESLGEGCGRVVILDEGEGPIAGLLDFVKAVQGRLYEAILGVDVGSSKLAYVLLSAGAVLYSGFEPPGSRRLLGWICSASRRHPELVVAVGSSPSMAGRALGLVEELRACGARVYLVDEHSSNRAPLLGVRGAEKLAADDLRAAAAIALRAFIEGYRL
ncbi:hypothetical protein CF15_02540 [Pyrodictium occultum]|uniref:Uncharacterized protein n=1 Tax=Pyrodictium occultum TaxID=2309 RepID=A0A0V8RUQ7_PYROC|nr:hypothetical protein [Pyrodictium occultum]KSW11714.1 hypothetical protein CF15_02540 [Pyrodictium occultum]